jgi:hypothetical protein
VARSGAGITELNCVRKHLSRIKGGRLAAATPARLCALILSDVVGDDPSVIGSGPACADPTTFAEALAIARAAGAPGLALLEAGARGEREETPQAGRFRRLARVDIEVLAGPRGPGARRRRGGRASRPHRARRAACTGTVEELAGSWPAAPATAGRPCDGDRRRAGRALVRRRRPRRPRPAHRAPRHQRVVRGT